MTGLLGLWLRAISLVVPAGERERWREEWLADIDDARASGADASGLVSLAAGMTGAALTFRFEGMTMDGWMKEVAHSIRGLIRRPAFTVIAVMTLGLGIGANTAIFSVVNGVVLEPLRYPDSGELVMLSSAFPTNGLARRLPSVETLS